MILNQILLNHSLKLNLHLLQILKRSTLHLQNRSVLKWLSSLHSGLMRVQIPINKEEWPISLIRHSKVLFQQTDRDNSITIVLNKTWIATLLYLLEQVYFVLFFSFTFFANLPNLEAQSTPCDNKEITGIAYRDKWGWTIWILVVLNCTVFSRRFTLVNHPYLNFFLTTSD